MNFYYLPINFQTKQNFGYAFLNFRSPISIVGFYKFYNMKKLDASNSNKICHISYARIQGLDNCIDHFENSSIMKQTDQKLKPIIIK